MSIEELWILIGLVGFTLVISGSNVLPQFRQWCQGFESPTQPLRWLGVALEFIGIVSDKSMATGFLIGMCWWRGKPWSELVVSSGQLALAAALADSLLALLDGLLKRALGPNFPMPGPIPIPRRGSPEEPAEQLKMPTRKGGPLTEAEAFATLDAEDDEVEGRSGG